MMEQYDRLCFSSSDNATHTQCHYFYTYLKHFLFYGIVQSGEEKAWGDLIVPLGREKVIKKLELGS